MWTEAGTSDIRIKLPLLIGAGIIVGGSFASGALFFLLNLAHTKALSKNTEDLHGSARWATKADIEETNLIQARRGVYVGGWYEQSIKHLHYLRHNGPEHILAFAPTRSGKGVGIVIPTLLAWAESAVVYDIKGENWAKTAGFRSQAGQVCFKFAPVEPDQSSRFNPLAEIRLFTERDVSDAQNIADMLVRSDEDKPEDRYWQEAAASITTGMILHACYAALLEGRQASLSLLGGVFTRPGFTFRETLTELLTYTHDKNNAHNWRLPTGEATCTHPVVREKAQEMLDKEDRDFSSVLSTAKTALTLYSDPLVSRATCASDFTIQDLVNHERPVSLYLVVPPSDKIRLRPLMRLIFTMIVNRLTEKLDFHGSEQLRNKHRLLFLIDEFPSLKRMEIFADALSYMAGYGLKAYLITQDINGIICGHNNAMTDNSGAHNFPTAEWGARIKVQAAPDFYAMGGVYQVNPNEGNADNGWNLSFHGTGIFVPVELGWTTGIGSGQLPGTYKIGAYYNTSTSPDVFTDVNGHPAGLTGKPFEQHDGRAGGYIMTDQMVYRERPDSARGLTVGATVGVGDTATDKYRTLGWPAVTIRVPSPAVTTT